MDQKPTVGLVSSNDYRKNFIVTDPFETGVLRRVLEITEKIRKEFNQSEIEKTIRSLEVIFNSDFRIDESVRQKVGQELERYKLIRRIYDGVL